MSTKPLTPVIPGRIYSSRLHKGQFMRLKEVRQPPHEALPEFFIKNSHEPFITLEYTSGKVNEFMSKIGYPQSNFVKNFKLVNKKGH